LVVAAPLAVVGEAVVGNLGYDVGAHDTKCCADGNCDSTPTVGGGFLGACVNVQKGHADSLQRDGQKPPLELYDEAKGLHPCRSRADVVHGMHGWPISRWDTFGV
jgi:hypothetical protein